MNKKEKILLLETIVNRVTGSFPENTDFKFCHSGEEICTDSVYCRIYWYLKDDAKRQHKSSKEILLILSHEFFEDYKNLPDNSKKAALTNTEKWINAKLHNFDPTNDTEAYEIVPHEKWCIPLQY